MKLQLTKKLFAFIITIMMFSAIPTIANAQQRLASTVAGRCFDAGICPRGYICVNGFCVRFHWHPHPKATNDVLSSSDLNSAVISLELSEPQNVSLKVYDTTGRLINILADNMMAQGEHQIEWDQTDQSGNIVNAGIYILHLKTGDYSTDTTRLFVIN